jgi:hypothetical protein
VFVLIGSIGNQLLMQVFIIGITINNDTILSSQEAMSVSAHQLLYS